MPAARSSPRAVPQVDFGIARRRRRILARRKSSQSWAAESPKGWTTPSAMAAIHPRCESPLNVA